MTTRVCGMAAAALVLTAACGDRITDLQPDDTSAAQVVINPAAVQLLSGAGKVLSVAALDAHGQRLPDYVSSWTSSNPAVAIVSRDGLVTALQPGSAILTATSYGARGTCQVTVEARQLYGWQWARELPDTSGVLTAVWGSGETDVFAVGFQVPATAWFEPLILHYDGSSWSRMQAPRSFDQALTDIWGSSEADVFAVGNLGLIGHYDGRTWSRMATSAPPGACFARIWGSSRSDVYAVGAARCDPWGWDAPAEPLVLHYDGSDWGVVSLPLPSLAVLPGLQGVWGSSASDVYAVGNDLILHYDGKDWSRTELATGVAPLLEVWGSSGNDVFAVGSWGVILHYDGQSWSEMPAPGGWGGSLTGIWGTSRTDVFAVGAGRGLMHYDGTSWGTAELGPEVTDIWTMGGNAFAVGPRITIMHGER